MTSSVILVLIGLARAAPIEDQPLDDLLDLLDDQVDSSTTVADRVARSQREAPALVTVLTGDELRRLGARDLLDALRLLPAIEFGGDIWNSDALLFRGTDASEGRVLLLVDGHEWNEGIYGSMTFGNRLPVSMIDRIEIIRGPGSAVYGGAAMLAVIRVQTRAPTIAGVTADAWASWLPSGVYGRQGLSLSMGTELGDDGHVGVSAVAGRGRRTDDAYTDVYGHEVSLVDGSDLDPHLVTASLAKGGLDVALAVETYRTTFQDGSAHVLRKPHESLYSGIYGRVGWTGQLGEDALLRLHLVSRWQEPWRSTSWPLGTYSYTRDRTDRTIGGVELVGEPVAHLEVQVGAEGGVENADAPDTNWYPPEIERHPSYGMGAAWSEVSLRTDVTNVTGGARYDLSSAFGDALSPRVAIGRAWKRFHYKAGVNRSFRAPGIAQARSRVDPETATTVEAELGVGPTSWTYLTGSVFRTRLYDPLVYFYRYDAVTGDESEGYENGDGLGAYGGEVEAQLLSGPVSATAGWGFVVVGDPAAPPSQAVPGEPGRALAEPTNKGVLRVSVDPGGRVDAGAVVTWIGPRWAIATFDGGLPVYGELPAVALVDLAIGVRHVGVRGLSVRATCHDLLDRNPSLIQAYDGGHAPLPASGRELLLQLTLER